MRAAFYTRFGAPRDVLQIGEVATPEPGPGEVRVRVAASGVNPVDWKIMGGQRSARLPAPVVVPNGDGAGTVDAVGTGVDAARLGQRVWVHNGATRRPLGTCAQYVVVPAELAVELPANVPLPEGACLGIPALTAHRAVTVDGPVAGQTVVVSGGAGAVGNYAIQWAKHGGARVIATASTPQKAEVARAAGADHVVLRTAPDAAEQVAALVGKGGIDRLVETDLAANIGWLAPLLAHRGVVAVYGSGSDMSPRLPFATMTRVEARVHFIGALAASPAERAEGVARITELLARGALRQVIAARLPLDRALDAFERVMAGGDIGKVIVEPW